MYKTDDKVEVNVNGQWYSAHIKAVRPYGDHGAATYTVQPILNGDTTTPKGPFSGVTDNDLRAIKETFKEKLEDVRDKVEAAFGIGRSTIGSSNQVKNGSEDESEPPEVADVTTELTTRRVPRHHT